MNIIAFFRNSPSVLKDKVKHGGYTNRDKLKKLHGVFLDIKNIATYAPCCNAFLMDKEMASLVSDRRVGLEKRYGVKVFSLNNWDQFIEWLDVLESRDVGGVSCEFSSSISMI